MTARPLPRGDMAAKTEREAFFTRPLEQNGDEALLAALRAEAVRQADSIELIAAENLVSYAVAQAAGTVATNKYAEGYPGARYYGGCEAVDELEALAIDRACKLFNCGFANVQPHSGSQANFAAYAAMMPIIPKKEGATMPFGVNHLGQMRIVGLALDSGGHLTHGAAANASGIFFDAKTYGLDANGEINYDEMERLVQEHKPRVLVGGASAYSGQWDMARMAKIAHDNGALFMFDMAHIAGLVAAGVHPSPLEHADIVTTTTHKTLRGPRGGMILTDKPDLEVARTAKGEPILLGDRINSRLFPGIQGGPLMHVIAAKAVAFGEALQPSFKHYGKNVINNAKALAETIIARGINVVSGGTTNHLMLVDLRALDEGKGLEGNLVESVLELAGLTANKNAVPGDTKHRKVTSGIRLGTPAGTTRGFNEEDFKTIGNLIADVVHALAKVPQAKRTQLSEALMHMAEEKKTMHEVMDGQLPELDMVLAATKREVARLCAAYPIYPQMGPARSRV